MKLSAEDSSSSTTAVISIRNVMASYKEEDVLQGIDLDIFGGCITAIIGPSGCGKSTLLRCINRMHELKPGTMTSGSIQVHGREVFSSEVDVTWLRRKVGMVFQEPNPFPTMSIRENVLAGLKLTNSPSEKSETAVVEDALRDVGLWDEVKNRLNTKATSLSAGQQQRLCIARAIAVSPDILLMDEPCSSLDPIATAHIENLIQSLVDRFTIVVVTHNMQQAARISQRTAFLLSGELIEYSETGILFTAPKDQRTEDYITGRFG